MAEFKFKVGDLVKLKSGGPNMTIMDTATDQEGVKYYYTCRWHDDKSGFGERNFIEESLIAVE